MTYARRNKPSFGLLNRDPYKTPFFSFRTTSHKLHISPSSLDINGSSNTTNSSPSPSPTTPPTVIPTTWIPASTDLPDSDGNQSKRSFSIRLRPIEGEIDTQTLRSLFDAILPVRYNDQFYNAVCHINGQDMSLLAYWKDQCIGSICCRREPLSELRRSPRCCRIYIMTLGVLAPFRRLRVGTALLNQMISTLTTDPSVDHICLHVQTSNEEALNFYRRHGFVVRSRIDGYYKQNPGVSPPDAYFLTLNV
ncbi:acyl-CoA N-acyltransferase [Cladochytrium replicatum]|nr:acyl-CoA N-acyltransferase [Cladochytrium replicatum]